MQEEYLTVPETAVELSVRVSAVHNAIQESRLPFTVKYGRKVINRADLEAYKARTRPDGEKPKGRPAGSRNTKQKETGGDGAN